MKKSLMLSDASQASPMSLEERHEVDPTRIDELVSLANPDETAKDKLKAGIV